MSPRVCPRCRAEVPSPQRQCDKCGAALTSTALVAYPNPTLVPARPSLPALRPPAVRPLAALSLVGVGLKLAQIWLRHRAHRSLARAATPPEWERYQALVVIQHTIQVWNVRE